MSIEKSPLEIADGISQHLKVVVVDGKELVVDLNGETSRWKTIWRGLKDQLLSGRGLADLSVSIIAHSPLSAIVQTSRSIIDQDSNSLTVTIGGETKKVYRDHVFEQSLSADSEIKLRRRRKNSYFVSLNDKGGMVSNKTARRILAGLIYDSKDKLVNVTSADVTKTDIKNLVEIGNIGNMLGAYHEARILNDIKTAGIMLDVGIWGATAVAAIFTAPAACQGGPAVAAGGIALKHGIIRGLTRKAGSTIAKRVLTRKAGLTIAKRAAIGAGIYDAAVLINGDRVCLLYTSPSPRDGLLSRMPSSA